MCSNLKRSPLFSVLLQNEDLRQHQYCPMFQPVTFRDLRGSVVIANAAKSPIDLSLFRLVRPAAGGYAYAPPALENNPDGCRIKREPNDERCPSSQRNADDCTCGASSCFRCSRSKFAAEADSSGKNESYEAHASSHHEAPVQRRHLAEAQQAGEHVDKSHPHIRVSLFLSESTLVLITVSHCIRENRKMPH